MRSSRAVRSDEVGLLPGVGWVLPWWLDQQRDPASPAYAVGDRAVVERNVTGRSWTVLGTLDGAWRPAIDRAGMLSPGPGRAGIDWWVRSGDRWIHPSQHRSIRQACLGATPAIETRLRIGGGDVVHRSAAARLAGGADGVVIEIENDTPAPVAVAVVVRPFDLLGAVRVSTVEWDAGALTLSVDGHPTVRFPRPPGEVLMSDGSVDVAELLGAADRSAGVVEAVDSSVGRAQAAVVHPLVHTSALRIIVGEPAGGPARSGRRRRARRRAQRALPSTSESPSVASVAAGWRAQTERATRWELPPGPVEAVFAAARRHLLLFRSGPGVMPRPYAAPASDWSRGAGIAAALSEVGYRVEADELVAGIGHDQHAGGQIGDDSRAVRSTAAAVVAAGHHWRLHRDADVARDLGPAVAGAIEWLARRRQRDGSADELLRGLVPPEAGGRWCYLDSAWSLRAFLDGADLLAAGRETSAAADATRLASDLRVDLMHSLDAGRDDAELPVEPGGTAGEQSTSMLAMLWPLRLLPADHPRIAATVGAARSRVGDGPAIHRSDRPRGYSVLDTAQLAAAELARGERAALDRIRWLAASASPTGTWPTRVHPRAGSGTAGEGHDGRSSAAYVRLVRALLLADDIGAGRLQLARQWPGEWAGHGLEVHDAPTAIGRVSYAVRWHGQRPALLWEVVPHTGIGPVTISAPGLDAGWTTDESTGEALLEPWDDDETSGPPGGIGRPPGPASSPPGDPGSPVGSDIDPDGSFA